MPITAGVNGPVNVTGPFLDNQFAADWGKSCCDAWLQYQQEDVEIMGLIDDPNNPGGPQIMGVVKSAPRDAIGLACYNEQQQAATAAWEANQEAWLESYQEYQNCIQGPYIIQTMAALAQMCRNMILQQQYQECANSMLTTLKTTVDTVANEFLGEAGQLRAHVCEINKGFATRICNIDTKKQWHCNLTDSVLDCYTNLYKKCEDDHWLNLCTHLAQICTNGRDSSNNYLECLDEWKDCHTDTFKAWETATGEGEGGFNELCATLATMFNKADDILCHFEECGTALQNQYFNHENPDDPEATSNKLKALTCQLLDEINNEDPGGIMDQIRQCTDETIECFENIRDQYKEQNLVCEEELTPLALGQAKCLFEDGAVTVPSAQAGNGDGMSGTAAIQFNGSSFFKDCTAFLEQAVVDKLDVFTRYVGEINGDGNSSGEHCLGRVIIDQACGLVNDLQAAVTFMDMHADNCIADYEEVYHDKEHLLAQAVMQCACDLAACFKTVHEYLCEHAERMDQCYIDGYGTELTKEMGLDAEGNPIVFTGGTEKGFAQNMLLQADFLADKHCGVFGWFTNCAFEAKSCWDESYKDKIKALDCDTMECATEMTQCAKLAHGWLCDQADKLNDHWCEFYKPKEEEYVCAVLEKALELACEARECLDDMCEKADEWCEWFQECYQDQECIAAKKLIPAITPACEKNEIIYEEFCDNMRHMYGKWEDEWCQCDIDDLKKHCEVWEKQNFLEEICDNANCARDMADRMKDCYYEFLECEKEYIELCVWQREKYDPKFCDMEDRALLHVRKAFDMQREDLERCASKFCVGALQDQMKDLIAMQVKAEAATMSQTNHWEKLWQTQEDDRNHRYHMEAFQYVEGWADRSLRAYEQSTQGNDLILARINERIVRGYRYLDAHRDFGQQALSGINQALTSGLRAIDLGHFWPAHWLNTKTSAIQNSISYLNVADDILRIGQQHVQQSANDKVQAAQIADAAVGRGHQSIGHGHTILNLAREFEQLGMQTMDIAEKNGLQTIGLGQFYHQQGASDKVQAAQVAQQATGNGLQTIGLGHNVKSMAVDASNMSGNLASNGVGLGLQSIDRGHWWAEQARLDKQLALDNAHQVTQEMYQGFQHGLANAGMALQYQQAAKDALMEKVDCAKETAQIGLSEYQIATNKMNVALEAACEGVRKAQDMYRIGRDRQSVILDGYRAQESAAIQSVAQFQQGVNIGHNQINRAASFNMQTLGCEKQMLEMACSMLRDFHFNSLNCVKSGAGAAFGNAAGLAADASAASADGFGGFLGGITALQNQAPQFTPTTTGGVSGGGTVSGGSTPPSVPPPPPGRTPISSFGFQPGQVYTFNTTNVGP